eukprot:PhM_4_TR14006/c0_g1_i1/m.13409
MPPKKPPKKPVFVDKAEEFLTTEELLTKSALRVEALEATLQDHVRELRSAHSEEQELHAKCSELEKDYDAVKQERFDVISDFTRQYKGVQDGLVGRLTQLENTMTDLRDQLDLSKLALSETTREKDQYLAQKEKEIQEQEEKMKEMAKEFDQMLAETLEKMSDRIDMTEAASGNMMLGNANLEASHAGENMSMASAQSSAAHMAASGTGEEQ